MSSSEMITANDVEIVESESSMAAVALKEEGNNAYREGRLHDALQLFSDAIDLDSMNSTIYCNRSMCKAALLDWKGSVSDARNAITLSPKYSKAHYRLIKAYLQLKMYKDARMNLLNAIRLCGECKELKTLEEEVLLITRTPLRPKPGDFDVLDELGEGNFTQIFKVKLKATNDLYAMKVRFVLKTCFS